MSTGKKIIEWRKSTQEEIEQGSKEMTKVCEYWEIEKNGVIVKTNENPSPSLIERIKKLFNK